MKASPAFQFYPKDWLSSRRVSMMSLEAEGAYIRLICHCWVYGSIPADIEALRNLIGKPCSTTLAEMVATMFEPSPHDASELIHSRLTEERDKQTAWREKSSIGGKNSSKSKQFSKGGSSNGSRVVDDVVEFCLQPNVNSLSSSSSPKGEEGDKDKRTLLNDESEIESIYSLYPRKAAKQDAIKAIRKALRSVTAETIIECLKAHIEVWRKDEKEIAFIPYPATWFNRSPWKEDLPVSIFEEPKPKPTPEKTDTPAEEEETDAFTLEYRAQWEARMARRKAEEDGTAPEYEYFDVK